MAKSRAEGWLILADISGYTKFLTGTELEHADAILEEIIRGLLVSVRVPLRLVKLEGDAIFAYALDADVSDGRAIVDRLEDAYHGFRMQLLRIARSSTCTCAACGAAPSLDLKFVVHRGEFFVNDLAGHDDLQGPDVILVHRLLKNSVEEKTGRRAYLLTTEAARARMGAINWIEHAEAYEHLGNVKCGVRCLSDAFEAMSASGASDVTAEEADVVATFDVAVAPTIAWDWHVDGAKVLQWQKGMTQWDIAANAEGRVRPGAVVHCAHGKNAKSMNIVSWRPPHSMTIDSPAEPGMPPHRFTASFTTLESGGTHVEWRVRMLRGGIRVRMMIWFMRLGFPRIVNRWARRLRELLVEEQARHPAPAIAPRAERHATAAS